ncbi:MAG: hypothetical protein QW775_06145 [Ignisphaera sp.]
MKSVLELGSKYVVPAIRREVVLKLIRKGFMGIEMTNLLGVLLSPVPRYRKSELRVR